MGKFSAVWYSLCKGYVLAVLLLWWLKAKTNYTKNENGFTLKSLEDEKVECRPSIWAWRDDYRE